MSMLSDVTKQALDGHFINPEVAKAWLDEADRRWQEIEEGKVQCLPADQVMKQARESLGR